MRTHRKITARKNSKNKKQVVNPAGFKFLKSVSNSAIDTLPEFHDGGEAHNAKYGVGHPNSAHPGIPAEGDFSFESQVGNNIGTDLFPIQSQMGKNVGTELFPFQSQIDQEEFKEEPITKPAGAIINPGFGDMLKEHQESTTDGTINLTPGTNPYKSDTAEGEDSDTEVEDVKDKQFFNPYAGVDVMGAANVLGQNIQKGGDPLTAIAAGLKVATGVGRSMASGAGYAKRNKFALDESEENKRKSMTSYADGGTNTQQQPQPQTIDEGSEYATELLTGDYSTGTENGPANVEVERGEYIKTPDSNVTKVLGDNHANGGEDMNLEQGTQIVSNKLKLNASQVKTLNDEYGVKASVKDTYAKTMDKFYKTIGLSDLIEEEEEIIESIKTQTEKSKEDGADESTFGINLDFLSGRINDITKEKEGLQKQATGFFDEVFKLQEATKPAEPAQTEFKIGGTVYSNKDIQALAKKYNLDADKAMSIVDNFSKGTEIAEIGLEVGDEPGDDEKLKRLKAFHQEAKAHGFKGEIDFSNSDLGVEAGKIQKFMAKNFPERVIEYFKTNAITSKGIVALQKSEKGKGVFTELGLDPSKAPGQYTKEERLSIQNAARESGAISREFILDQFQDNLWDFRAPTFGKFNASNFSQYGVNPDDLEVGVGDYDFSNIGEGNTNTTTAPGEESKVDGMGVYLLPDQSPLPPGGLQPHLKAKRRFGRMDATQITADTQLAELERSKNAAMTQINKLPASQRAAAVIQLEANVQTQSNQLLSKVEQANAASKQKTEAFNVRQGDREEEAKWADILNYEQRTLGAVANTEDDYRRFINEGQARNVANFNNINSLNLTNAMYENFDITNQGVEVTGTPGLREGFENKVNFSQGMAVGKTKTTKTKTAKAKKGGTVRRGRKA